MYTFINAFIFMYVKMEGRNEGLQGEKDIHHLEKTGGTT